MFTVVELQTNAEGQTGILTYSYATEKEALSKYHLILSAAAVSALPCHSAIVMDEKCTPIRFEYYAPEEI